MTARAGVAAFWDNSDFLKGQAQYIAGINAANRTSSTAASAISGLGAAGTGGLLPLIAIGTAVGSILSNIATSAMTAASDMARFAVTSVAALQNLQITVESLSARELLQSQSVGDMGEAMQLAVPMAQNLLDKIKDLSLTSPFEYKDILSAFQVSMAFGMASDSAVEFTRAATNLASVNKGIPDVLNRITYNFSQMGMQAKITMMDVRQLAQAGVDLGVMLREGLGMSVEEANAALESGKITMADITAAFVTYSDKYFGAAAERASRTLSGLTSSFKDLAFFASADIFKPALDRIGQSLGGVFDKARGLLDSGVLKNIGALLDIIAEQAIIAGGNLATWLGEVVAEWSGKLSTITSDAFTWGANIAINLATGLIQGAATALTYAMNWISNLLSGWLAPGSPPKVAPDLPEWGAAAMGEWLGGMTQADFNILNAIQGPLQDALNVMVSAGEMTRDEMGDIFADISEDIIQALASGQIDAALFDKIRAAAGEFGQELVELAQNQIALAQAEEQVTAAEKALTDARKRESDAGKAVNDATLEYNQLLRSGADPGVLKAKMAQINAAKKAQAAAKKETAAAEGQVDAAKEGLDILKAQVKLQEELLRTMIELARARQQETGTVGGVGGVGGTGGPLPLPRIDTEALKKQLDDAIEAARQMILTKLGTVWDAIKIAWDAQIAKLTPAFTALSIAWENLKAKLQPILDWLKTAWGDFLTWLGGEVQYWTEFAAGWWERHGESVATVWQGIQDAISAAITFIGEVIDMALVVIQDMWSRYGEDILAQIGLNWETIKTLFGNALEYLGNTFDFFAAVFKGDWAAAWEEVKQNFSLMWDSVALIFSTWWEAFKLQWQIAWSEIKLILTGAWDEIVAWLNVQLPLLQAWWDTTWGQIAETVSTAWTGIGESIYGKMMEIWDALFGPNGYISGLGAAISGFAGALYDAGANLIQGMIDGVLDSVGGLIDAVTQAIRDAIQAAHDALNMESPSKVFLAIGENTMKALSKGIAVTADIPQLAMQRAVSNIIPTAPVPVTYGGASYRTMNMTINNSLSNQMDVFALENLILRTVRKAMAT